MVWGWNSERYSDSRIHFWGDGYDFTLKGVQAKEKWKPIAYNPHFKIDEITKPQTNVRLGYFIKDNLELSIGVDHMKYVMVQGQSANISGRIDTQSDFDGIYDNTPIDLRANFLMFEHTDGLNYGNIELAYFKRINSWLKIPENRYINLDGYVGGGAGLIIPKTNSTLMERERYDEFNLAGFGLGGKLGLNVALFRWVILRYEWKMGYIDMPNIRTTHDKNDHASQSFFFTENLFTFGFQHRF